MALVDKRDLAQGRLLLLQARPDPHQLGHLHRLIAHVDRVPACAQLWRTLDHGWSEPIALDQYARVGPAILAPEMRMVVLVRLIIAVSFLPGYGPVARRSLATKNRIWR